MSPFQLLSVDDNMLEKIIEKLQPKEYFLLQQTCRGVKEFILSTRNVSIWLWGEYYITFKKDKKSQWQLYCCRNGLALKLKNLEVFYGLRLATMISPGANKEYEQLYNSLKNYRITCDEIRINGQEWNGEQSAAIVKVVKPSRVVLYNMELTVVDFEEIFFHSKTVKDVDVGMNLDVVTSATARLLSRFQRLTIRVPLDSSDIPYQLIRDILESLFLKDLPNLRIFNFHAHQGNWNLPPPRELEQEFHGQRWARRIVRERNEYFTEVHVPEHFAARSFCSLTFKRPSQSEAHIYYTRN